MTRNGVGEATMFSVYSLTVAGVSASAVADSKGEEGAGGGGTE